MSEEELKILLAVAHSDNSECDFDTLVRTLNLAKAKVEYCASLLSFERHYLLWIDSTAPDGPDRYRLTNQGYQFLRREHYI